MQQLVWCLSAGFTGGGGVSFIWQLHFFLNKTDNKWHSVHQFLLAATQNIDKWLLNSEKNTGWGR